MSRWSQSEVLCRSRVALLLYQAVSCTSSVFDPGAQEKAIGPKTREG